MSTNIIASSRLNALLESHAQNLVGAALAVVSGGKIDVGVFGRLDVGKDGLVDTETAFPLWSTAKVWTATLVCQLAEQGRLSLDDLLEKWLPETSKICEDFKPTIRQVLSHSAGFVDLFEPIDSIDALIAKLRSHGPLAKPGEMISYSNAGYILLGFILTRITGSSWATLVRSQILNPLQLTNVRLGDESGPETTKIARDHAFGPDGKPFQEDFFPPMPLIFAPAGTTVTAPIGEAAIILASLLLGSPGDLIRPETRQMMQALQIRTPGPSIFCDGWGLGWSVIDEPLGLVGHMGGSSVYMLGNPGSGKAAIFLSNTSNGAELGRHIARQALGMSKVEPPTPNSEVVLASGLEGHYTSPLFAFDVSIKNSKLSATTPMSPDSIDLEPTSEMSFIGRIASVMTEFNFLDPDKDLKPRYLHVALRALRRS